VPEKSFKKKKNPALRLKRPYKAVGSLKQSQTFNEIPNILIALDLGKNCYRLGGEKSRIRDDYTE